ncbi:MULTISPECIES: SRPBCC family protein [unclassified Pseudomonas]|uniref:SRPBCC family protein n=1 Tax=unclassified Pseudomonas TaxID=196821 RepID=UPI002AC9CC57|nr:MULTISPECIES: SRPBCC family protein [unclassified Pseudomonas]MEB0040075.1 SRPBCC family protein [Pseudomonas sp. MH10]MEB0080002.1 SRPBCC family protein [Pseudomonas sp. MH10out]MEB0093847.1 SRPBCC family protein [Pseudomonas sp. CCI4.2]MEB0103633.1 SRPBCC family protein [Pseudomonas sp. CCI3.2]MEB0122316.1 SRPBCC family protein [Pseudomonas sp. CCI1.2]
MAKASATIEVSATADQVWQLMGGFGSLPDWLPFIVECELGEGGRVRHLKTNDGAVIVERLQTFDNAARTYTYSIEQGPFPVTDYLAKVEVSEVPGKHSTNIVWSGTFTCAGITEEAAAELFDGVYRGGLAALKSNFPS